MSYIQLSFSDVFNNFIPDQNGLIYINRINHIKYKFLKRVLWSDHEYIILRNLKNDIMGEFNPDYFKKNFYLQK